MGRAPCCDKASVKKGPWSPEEDAKLKDYIEQHGTGGNWIALPQKIGLKRCGKSCRLRWLNYLRPNIKHGGFSEEEDNIICSLYVSIGSRWSIIAAQLPGRTDNDIKNYWNTRLKKKLFGRQHKARSAGRIMTRSSKEAAAKRGYSKENDLVNVPFGNGIINPSDHLYWPQLPDFTPSSTTPSQIPSLNYMHGSFRDLLTDGGGRFSEDQLRLIPTLTSFQNPIDMSSSSMNYEMHTEPFGNALASFQYGGDSISCDSAQLSGSHFNNMNEDTVTNTCSELQGFVEDEVVYSNQQNSDVLLEAGFCGDCSSGITSTAAKSDCPWNGMSSLVSPLRAPSHYGACHPGVQQNIGASFGGLMYYALQ